ncbi:hypothetical protein MNBD_GAMMA15-1576 [hydrothermal vent metagenome]|uniref:N-acetyltransferase domain-containing protein n=1 Tax=hydrothermal vent metagenome TaxID=652676 RepID=A0A3B0YUS1_9ZZZZ
MGSLRLNMQGIEVRRPNNRDEQEACFALRWEVLCAPWQQPRGIEQDEQEDSARTYLAIDPQGKVLATARIQSIEAETAQVRYMAVRPGYERKGLGKRLLATLEDDACRYGETRIILHSRENALAFYRHCGYRVICPSHLLFDAIQHYEMEKHLRESTG